MFDTAKPFIKDANAFIKFCVALFITSAAGVVSYPFDTVRRRLMMQSGRSAEDVVYKGAMDCFVVIAREEGMRAFFKGSLSNIMRGTGGALVLTMYDTMQDAFFE